MAKRKQLKPVKAKLDPDHPFYALIEQAFEVFDYPKPMQTGVCQNCCMYPEVEKDFLNPDIRDLPLHYVRDWFFAAFEGEGISRRTWGYLLPRILEILAAGEDPASVAREVSLSRFETGVRAHWSEAEWAVLDQFQRAYLEREKIPNSDYLDDTICMFGLAGWPLQGLLDQVTSWSDEVLVNRFWHDWCKGRPSIWITAFWDEEGQKTVRQYYSSPELTERIEAYALAADTPVGMAEKALDVAAVMRAHRLSGHD